MYLSPALKRLIYVALAVLLSSLTGLAMASVQAGAGAEFVGRWLTGWSFAALLTLPLALSIRTRPQRQAGIIRRYKTPARHPRRLG